MIIKCWILLVLFFFRMTAIFDLTELSHVKPMLADSIKYVREYERKPRCIKTHLPWHLLPRQIQTKTKRPRVRIIR